MVCERHEERHMRIDVEDKGDLRGERRQNVEDANTEAFRQGEVQTRRRGVCDRELESNCEHREHLKTETVGEAPGLRKLKVGGRAES